MEVVKNIVIKKGGIKPILVDFFYKKRSKKMPIVIFCHGYKGFKDWGAWNLVGKEFANKNFFFIKFNFSHNGGTVENPIDFPDLKAFGNNNFSHELNDIERVLDFISCEKSVFENIDLKNIFLIGHSRGGGTCAIKASENKKIKGLISWAGVSDFESRFNKNSTEFKRWESNGVKYIENSRTKQKMPHYFQFYLDFKKNSKRLNIKSAVNSLKIPYLIIHGDKDDSVNIKEGYRLNSWNDKNKMYVIKNANHTFCSKHPWTQKNLPPELKQAVKKSIDFINLSLNL